MAQRTIVTLTCDLSHSEAETPAVETVSFAFDGTTYEVDVCGDHAKDIRETFGDYADRARKAAPSVIGRKSRSNGSNRLGGARPSQIRDWAKDNGISVSERGRIPANVMEQYEAATA